MTKQQFVDAVLAEVDVQELLPNTEVIAETKGDYEKGYFEVLLTEPQGGKNFRTVWFIRNTQTDETDWQTANTIAPEKNNVEQKIKVLSNYVHSNFLGGKILHVDTENNYAEAIVFEASGEKRIWIYKPQDTPLTHVVVEANNAI